MDRFLTQISEAHDQAARLYHEIKELPELEAIDHGHVSNPNSLLVVMPNNPHTYKQNKQILEAYGWKEDHLPSLNQSSGCLVASFRKDDLRICILLETYLPGATCERNLVGYRQEPVYEVTCKEGHNE